MTPEEQLEIISQRRETFESVIAPHIQGEEGLKARSLTTIQLNIGKRCNQSCRHCHVGASPTRTEMMNRETMEQCLALIAGIGTIEAVDITGGAPELSEHFTWLVTECKRLGKHVIDRCNLTILEEPGYEYLYRFFVEHDVEVMASLPHFRKSFTDRQRGSGVFDTSISALQTLNAEGYGTTHRLNLIYNPAGAYLSAPQQQLEREFREQLAKNHDVVFSHLYCINNMPLDGFLRSLLKAGKLDAYMELLVNAFNPGTLDGLMCRHQMSVSYDGFVYDCDFNQMLDMRANAVSHLRAFEYDAFLARTIRTANHCFGCTAGAGSSCGGEIV